MRDGMALRREVAELLGNHIVNRGPDWWELRNPHGDLIELITATTQDEAWNIACKRFLPAWEVDPAAALGLLVGDSLEWCANTSVSGERKWVKFVCMSAHGPRHHRNDRAEVIDGDEAAAFALAATHAWAAWKRDQLAAGGAHE